MNIKRVIAREGLIMLGIIGFGCLFFLVSMVYPPLPKPIDYYAGLTQTEKNSLKELMDLREKYPEYDDLDNLTLANKFAEKYPQYQKMFGDIQSIHEKNKAKTNRFDVSTAKPVEKDIPAIERIKSVVSKMVDRGEPEAEIDKYILEQGVTIEAVRNYQMPKYDIFDEIEPKDLLIEKVKQDREKIGNLGTFVLLLGYPIYLLIRFILWAIKTLKAGA